MSNFRVGQKIVCVDDRGVTNAVKGCVYTVLSIAPFTDINGKPGVQLVEIKPLTHPTYYVAHRFRPLISQSDDIAMFKALLSPTPELVPTSD